jgi:PD-(D/E)XK nuclease superfamily
MTSKTMSSFLERTLAAYQNDEPITRYIEEALMLGDVFPEEYPVRVFNKERKFDNMYHPSSDVMAGELQLYYRFHPEMRLQCQEQRMTPTLAMTFQVGSVFHSVLQNLLIHLGFTSLDKVEVKFRNEERMIAGAVDVLELVTPDGTFLVDIKSTNQLPKEASEQYAMQLRVYQDNCPGAPDRMALLFVQKAYPHKIKTIEVKKDDEALQKIYDKWDRVRVAIKNNSSAGLKHCCNGPTDEVFLGCPARKICEYWNK